ncbi:MAG: hypothetical protein JWL66_2399 [Sphingomonadales bacterium]|nr:hypothetical protein [Sphingomonadales bacterium]
MLRILQSICLFTLVAIALPARAASSAFDLVGPRLNVSVTREGVTLPLSQVPNLAEGDRVSVAPDPARVNGERYRIVAAFLRGAVDRPPKEWFHEALSWKPKSATLSMNVPKGAQQMALFVMPESGGSLNAIVSAVRKQPGAFVRAVQELNQASLDRARLDTFLREMQRAERKSPESVAAISPILTRSLSIKLKSECLQLAAETQSACLTGDRETLLLQDTHSSALADTLSGAPTDLAFQLSATPQAGYGSYSSYIGVIRDVFRLFGAFQSSQLQYIPALAQMPKGGIAGGVGILLNTPVSFAKPTSVMVVGLPAIEAPKPPPLRRSDPDTLSCARPGMVLGVEGAPLIYATDYAHDMALQLTRADGTKADVALRSDPSVGGFVADGPMPAGPFAPVIAGQLHGRWGFSPFEGPGFALSQADGGNWKAVDRTSLVAGRSNELELLGDGAGCVTQVQMQRGDAPAQDVTWKQSGQQGIVVTLPLEKVEPGRVSVVIKGAVGATPSTITLKALREAGSLDDFVIHAGDDEALLTGSRLDQVTGVTVGTLNFQPGALTRVDRQDRLTLRAVDIAAATALDGKSQSADVTFIGGRHKKVDVTFAPRRAAVTLLHVTGQSPDRHGNLMIALPASQVFAQDARLSFAFRLEGSTALSGRETIEIGTADGRVATMIQPGKGYDLQDASTGIVAFGPADALGPTGYGPLRFRVVSNDAASAWTPLPIVARLPEIRSLVCARGKACRISGNKLFLIKAVGTTKDLAKAQDIPDGFVATEIMTPAGPDGRIYLQLRDAPQAAAASIAAVR